MCTIPLAAQLRLQVTIPTMLLLLLLLISRSAAA
jgi:hypothetical protein